jgi:hypothetical protein
MPLADEIHVTIPPHTDLHTLARRQFLKRAAIGTGVAAASIALVRPVAASPAVSDLDVLNYALTLEHLEYAFYRDGLTALPRGAFQRSRLLRGLGGEVTSRFYGYLQQIADHERVHVETLETVITSLGGTPVTECTYSFGYQDADGFLNVAQVLENTGVMAYDGAVALIQSPELQTAAATIATVEARHASYLNLLNGTNPFPAAFDTPKTMDEILAAAGGFIVSC